MKGKEWDSGVGRDGTYRKCGRKKGKLRERNQQQQERLLGRLGGGKPPAVHDSLELLDDGLAPSWLRNIRAKLHQASLILLHLDSGRLPLICWANAARGLVTLVSAHASCSPAVSKV